MGQIPLGAVGLASVEVGVGVQSSISGRRWAPPGPWTAREGFLDDPPERHGLDTYVFSITGAVHLPQVHWANHRDRHVFDGVLLWPVGFSLEHPRPFILL